MSPIEPTAAITTRDRRIARAERLRDWAKKREAKSGALHEEAGQLLDVIPVGQPILVGHHSERRHRRYLERTDRKLRAAVENDAKAAEMARRADSIERAAAHAIYSDDADAIERLRERIADLTAEHEAKKKRNAEFRRDHCDTLKALTSFERDRALPHPSFELKNLGGRIGQARQRLARMEEVAR